MRNQKNTDAWYKNPSFFILKKIVGIGTRLKMNSVQDPTINDNNAYLVTIIESKKRAKEGSENRTLGPGLRS